MLTNRLKVLIGLIIIVVYGAVRMESTPLAVSERYHNLPVLVTGGAGFIGSHLVSALVDLGAQVTILDDFSTGSRQNLAHITKPLTIIEGSITDAALCVEATQGKAIVFHLAAFISVPESIQQPKRCYDVNVQGTLNILEACRLNGVEQLVFSSSSAVYGSGHAVCSETSSTKPESPYGSSKLMGELLCQQYAQHFGLKTICLRYFNVYGDRQNPNGSYAAVVAKFNNQMRNNLPITIFGDGTQTRDFVPVTAVANTNILCGLLSAEQLTGEPLNVATGRSITLLELVESLKKEHPEYRQPITFAPARAGDIHHSQADCHRLASLMTPLQKSL